MIDGAIQICEDHYPTADAYEAACVEFKCLRGENAKLKERVEFLETRLEIDCCYVLPEDGGDDLVRKELSPEERETFPDGIDCRDATIKLIEDSLDEVRSQRDRLREALKPFAEIAAAVASITEGWVNHDVSPIGLQYPTSKIGDLRSAHAAYEETGEKHE
jgi:hypothetical protein